MDLPTRRLVALSLLVVAAITPAIARPGTSMARTPAATPICGDLIGANVWNVAGSPYEVTCTAKIAADASLTIEAGVEVRFASEVALENSGTLTINGSSGSNVVLTSAQDVPAKGDWRGLVIREGATTTISGAIIRWAGNKNPAIVTDAPLTLSNSTVENSGDGALEADEVDVVVTGTTFREITAEVIQVSTDGANTLELTGNTFEDNEGTPVVVDSNVQVIHSGNSARDNANNTYNAIVVGGTVERPVVWHGGDLPYVILQSVTVEADLTIMPNTWVKFAAGRGLNVREGSLATGDGEGTIHFTSVGDDRCADTAGRIDCDTNNDGDTPPQPGSWGTVRLGAEGATAALHDVEMSYGSAGMLTVDGPALTVTSARFHAAEGDAVRLDNVPASITDSEFIDNRGDAVEVIGQVPVTVTLQNNLFENNRGAVASVTADTILITGGNEHGDFTNGINGYRMTGRVTRPKTWLAGDLPFVIDGTVELSSAAATLNVQPGLVIKMAEDAALDVSAGRLELGAADGEPVLVTALSDDSCSAGSSALDCDTNGDGPSEGTKGYWRQISVAKESAGAVFRRAVMRWGGGTTTGGAIVLEHADSEIVGSSIESSGTAGIFIDRVSTRIDGATISDSRHHGIAIRGEAAGPVITLADTAMTGNEQAALHMDANVQLEFEGENTASGNGYNGFAVVDDVLDNRVWHVSPLPYVLLDRIHVVNNKTLTIEPGVVVKFDSDRDLILERGRLLAEGTPSDPIVFTALHDDSVAGQTPRSSRSPNVGDWSGIGFASTGVPGSRVSNAEIRYAGSNGDPAVAIARSDVNITDSSIVDGAGPAIFLDGVPSGRGETVVISGNTIERHQSHGVEMLAKNGAPAPTIQNNVIRETLQALRMEANVQPTLGGNEISDNAINGVVVHGEMTSRRAWSNVEVPWVLEGRVAIGTSGYLEVHAGTAIKALDTAGLRVQRGTLRVPMADTGDEPVKFTSIRDDSVCPAGVEGDCDTNGDGDTGAEALRGDWQGIEITKDAFPSALDNVEVRFAGSEDAAVLIAASSSKLIDSRIVDSGASGVLVEDAQQVELSGNLLANARNAGLVLDGDAGVTVVGNILTGNERSMIHEAEGRIVTADNVAIGNVHDAMLYCANITSDQVWEADLAREISCGVRVEGGVLVIEPGTVLLFQDGRRFEVRGQALQAEGVLLASVDPQAGGGAWRGVGFESTSSGFVRHSTFFASGGSYGAIESASGTVDVLFNTFLRMSGTSVSISGQTNANVSGNLFGEMTGSRSTAIKVDGTNASPVVQYNRIHGAEVGVDVSGGLPDVNLNSITDIRAFGIDSNNRNRPCVNGRQNWWGHPSGPSDDRDDGRENCGPQLNEGEGVPVGSHINYSDWLQVAPPDAPLMDSPMCGVTSQSTQSIAGLTSPGAEVYIYDGDEVVDDVQADSAGRFEAEVELANGPHRLSFEARGESDDLRSPRTGFRFVDVDAGLPVDPSGIRFEYGPNGSKRQQPIRDEAGCATGCGGPSSGRVTLPPDEEVVVKVPAAPSVSSIQFVQEGAPPVNLTQQGGLWVSAAFIPMEGPFRLAIDGQTTEECLGYIYPRGGGFVFADIGAPGAPQFTENFEGGIGPWKPGKWAIVADGHDGGHSITDSPDGSYNQDEENVLGLARTFRLETMAAPELRFWHKHNFARGDEGRVEARVAFTTGWTKLATFDGATSGWSLSVISLEQFGRESEVEIQFVVESNRDDTVADGWYIDDVSVEPGGARNHRYDEGEPEVANAQVTLLQRNPATGVWRSWDARPTGQVNPQLTDQAGRYGFYNLPPGEYRIQVESDLGPAIGEIVAVWDGTLEYQLPLGLGQPIYLPWTANKGRIN